MGAGPEQLDFDLIELRASQLHQRESWAREINVTGKGAIVKMNHESKLSKEGKRKKTSKEENEDMRVKSSENGV